MIDWEKIKDEIKSANKIVILSHKSPDGDSIGSSLALSALLKSQAKDCQVITPDPAPSFLSWLEGFDEIINGEDNLEKCKEEIDNADLLFCLDFNSRGRVGALVESLELKESSKIINIDHHQDPEHFAKFEFLEVGASSTAQLIYEFALHMNLEVSIGVNIAECIYTGILTDTGSFRFSSSSYRTHEIAANLLRIGVDSSKIYELVYDSYSIDRLKLLGYSLSDGLKIYKEKKLAIIALNAKELKKFNFKKGDTEGLVNYPLSIKDIDYSILLTEKEGRVRMSFRSKGSNAVNEFAKKYFNGGGHINAAGGISDLSVQKTIEKIESLMDSLK